jgi:phosphatidylserine/phosphatidylglycerophosphate/cardiolipin synthase-like enzyme
VNDTARVVIQTRRMTGQESSSPTEPATGDGAITFLHTPTDFYESILAGIRSARTRITLAALYLGSGDHEDRIAQAVHAALAANPLLTLHCIFDYHRSSRDSFQAIHRLSQVQRTFGDRVQVSLFRTNSDLGPGFMSLLQKFVRNPVFHETLGVFHCKFCVFDDTVLLTGANLSLDYFTNRQDRYWLIRAGGKFSAPADIDAVNISDFLCGFAAEIAPFCYQLTPSGHLAQPQPLTRGNTSIQQVLHLYASRHRTRLRIAVGDGPAGVVSFQPLFQYGACGVNMERGWFLSTFGRLTGKTGSKTTGNGSDEYSVDSENSDERWGPGQHVEVVVATPYPSFDDRFAELMGHFVACRSVDQPTSGSSAAPPPSSSSGMLRRSLEMLVPAATAHGFHQGKGLKGFVPELHRAAMDNALRIIFGAADSGEPASTPASCLSATPRSKIAVSQYERTGWTYHAKGMWFNIFSSPDRSQRDLSDSNVKRAPSVGRPVPDRMVIYVGSSNMGERSWTRDLELGFVVRTADRRLIAESIGEISRLQHHSHPLPIPSGHVGGSLRSDLWNRVKMSFFRVSARTLKTLL